MSNPLSDAARYVAGGPIVLVAHDPAWADAFARESALLAALLGDRIVELHHIGSTAIPGIVAKPVIDILAVVHEIAALDDPRVLEPLGYAGLGEFGIAGRRYFRKNAATGERTHQIHAYARGSAEITRHVDFRDYLCAHPGVAAAYASLKRELAARFASDVEGYASAKTAFVRDVEARAARWRTRAHPRGA